SDSSDVGEQRRWTAIRCTMFQATPTRLSRGLLQGVPRSGDAPVSAGRAIVATTSSETRHMQTHRIIASLVVTFGCALTLSACNDTSKNAADRAARTTAALDPRVTTTPNATSTNTLPAAVPVPPAESSPVITGAIPAPATSAETPVGFAK